MAQILTRAAAGHLLDIAEFDANLINLNNALDLKPEFVATVAALRALPTAPTSLLWETLGYWAAGDGGHAKYRWDSASTATDDGFSVLKITTVTVGRMILLHNRIIKAEQAGCKNDASLACDALVTAVQTALGANVRLIFGGGTFLFTTGVVFNQDGWSVRGIGGRQTVIQFTPSAEAVCFTFSKGASVIYDCDLGDLGFYSPNTTVKKTAIKISDASSFTLGAVRTAFDGGWTGANSVGIHLLGREIFRVSDLDIFADVPFKVSENPNSTISLDNSVIDNVYFIANNNPNVVIDTGVNITGVRFGGNQTYVKGTHGFFWDDTTSVGSSAALILEGVRHEQSQSANNTAYAVYIKHNYDLSNLTIRGASSSAVQGLLYTKKVTRIELEAGLHSQGAGYALNINNCIELSIRSSFFQSGSLVLTPGLVEALSLHKAGSTSPAPDVAWYVPDAGAGARQPIKIFGTNTYKTNALVVAGGTLEVPASSNNGRGVAFISVAGFSSVGPIIQGGTLIDATNNTVLLSSTANFAITNVAGKLCFIGGSLSGTSYAINNTAQSLHVVIDVIYR